MISECLPSPAALPLARSAMPTLPYALDEYARLSCLPDADDDLVFEAAAPLGSIPSRVPYVVSKAKSNEAATREEALLMALVDGVSPVSLLIQLAGNDPDLALVTICDLYARGMLDFY
jgi:hypothetical protein